MAIDHVVSLDCAPKRALGVEGLVDRIKARARAEGVIRFAREHGDQRPVESLTFKIGMMGAKGIVEEREASVSSLLQHSAALEQHRSACASCPANRGRREGFGCYQTINYPIRASTEEWLVRRLPPTLSCTAGYFFGQALIDFQWNGAQAAEMRESGRTFFESAEQLGIDYGEDVVIGSNVVFHMMFHLGHLGAEHAKLLCLFLGVLPHDIDANILVTPDWAKAIVPIPPQEGPEEQMADFLRACATSAQLGVDLLIDG
jgi:hypothetical protein